MTEGFGTTTESHRRGVVRGSPLGVGVASACLVRVCLSVERRTVGSAVSPEQPWKQHVSLETKPEYLDRQSAGQKGSQQWEVGYSMGQGGAGDV